MNTETSFLSGSSAIADSTPSAQTPSGSRMDPAIKARWVAALRSGEYKQAREAMRLQGGHCCLAVLCELHAAETGQHLWRLVDAEEGKFRYDDDTEGYLPASVLRWARLPHKEGGDCCD